jgi:hypothetical protein
LPARLTAWSRDWGRAMEQLVPANILELTDA